MSNNQNSGIVFDIKKFSIHDGPGIRTTIFLKGCPLQCAWCHNPEGISPLPEIHLWEQRCIACGECVDACPESAVSFQGDLRLWDREICTRCGRCAGICPAETVQLIGKSMSIPEVIAEIEKDNIYYDQSGGGVTFSGGEPLNQTSFLNALLKKCKELKIHTAVDTSGLSPWKNYQEIIPFTDLFLFDLKIMDDDRHKEFTGASNRLILDNLEKLIEAGKYIVVRVPVIPGINDHPENIAETSTFLSSLGGIQNIDILPYHRIASDKYRRMESEYQLKEIQPPSSEEMETIANQFRTAGFTVTIGG